MQGVLINPAQARSWLDAAWARIKPALESGQRIRVEVRKERRSDAQNRLMWSCLSDIARQVEWSVDGKMALMRREDWKTMFSASIAREQRVAAGIDGGFVLLGDRTSKMDKESMTNLIRLAHAFGDARGVEWSPTSCPIEGA